MARSRDAEWKRCKSWCVEGHMEGQLEICEFPECSPNYERRTHFTGLVRSHEDRIHDRFSYHLKMDALTYCYHVVRDS